MSTDFKVTITTLLFVSFLIMAMNISQTLPVRIHGYKVGLQKLETEACRILTNTQDTRTVTDVNRLVPPTPTKCF